MKGKSNTDKMASGSSKDKDHTYSNENGDQDQTEGDRQRGSGRTGRPAKTPKTAEKGGIHKSKGDQQEDPQDTTDQNQGMSSTVVERMFLKMQESHQKSMQEMLSGFTDIVGNMQKSADDRQQKLLDQLETETEKRGNKGKKRKIHELPEEEDDEEEEEDKEEAPKDDDNASKSPEK